MNGLKVLKELITGHDMLMLIIVEPRPKRLCKGLPRHRYPGPVIGASLPHPGSGAKLKAADASGTCTTAQQSASYEAQETAGRRGRERDWVEEEEKNG